MPEVIITYNDPKTLKALKGISKYFDFSISNPKSKKVKKSEEILINGVAMIRGTDTIGVIDHAEMSEIMARSNMDAKELRSRWQRKK